MNLASGNPRAVAIGASVGAIGALMAILPELQEGFPFPVFVVVHVPPDKRSLLPDLFADRCRLPVKEAEDKEPVVAGTIYFAPADYHLLVEEDFSLSLSNEEPVLFSRPAVDPLFESATDAYGEGLVAVVLTGASADGADGLRAAGEAGATCLVQLPGSAEGPTMPGAALAACPSARALSLREIASALVSLVPTA